MFTQSSSRALDEVSRWAALIGWVCFGAIFLLRRKGSGDKTRKSDPASIIGIILQMAGYAVAWSLQRRPSASILPLGFWFDLVTTVSVIAMVIASLWMMSAAVQMLGKQWSVQARVLERHELIRTGPYRIVRHPIYTGMFGMLIVAGLVFSHWIGLAIAVLVFGIGTVIRIKSEEKLLREEFGHAYEDYERKVPAFIPLLRKARM